MMGANMGYTPGQKPGVSRHFAWYPIGTTSGKVVWLRYVWDVDIMNPTTFNIYRTTMTEKEYLIWTIKNSNAIYRRET